MNTKRKGNVGEAKVIADLLEQDVEVAIPFGDNLPFDLNAIGPDLRLWKVQVKFARAYQGAIRVKNWRQSENTRRRCERMYTFVQVDVFAVYCPDTDLVYYVPQEEIGASATFHLRMTPTKNQQQIGVHWHQDYRSFRDASETTSSGPEMAKI
jgi:hypothetical protein